MRLEASVTYIKMDSYISVISIVVLSGFIMDMHSYYHTHSGDFSSLYNSMFGLLEFEMSFPMNHSTLVGPIHVPRKCSYQIAYKKQDIDTE